MKLSYSQKQQLEVATAHYQRSVNLAANYLETRRLGQQVAVTHRLGVVEDPLPGHETYVGRLAIPYITATGVVDIRFRSMVDGEEPKYLGLPGAITHLYNVTATFQHTDSIALCEGEIDTMTLSQLGVPAVGVPGVNNWKKHYNRVLADFENVFVFADGDQPGTDFARRLAKELPSVTVIQMPEGEDVNSGFCKFGESFLLSKLGRV